MINYEIRHSESKHLTDEEYFGVDDRGYLKLYVGRAKMREDKPNRKFKVKLKNIARPMYLNYNRLLCLNIEIEYEGCDDLQ